MIFLGTDCLLKNQGRLHELDAGLSVWFLFHLTTASFSSFRNQLFPVANFNQFFLIILTVISLEGSLCLILTVPAFTGINWVLYSPSFHGVEARQGPSQPRKQGKEEDHGNIWPIDDPCVCCPFSFLIVPTPGSRNSNSLRDSHPSSHPSLF